MKKTSLILILCLGNDENGKLINTTLLPETDNLEITPVGGLGKEFWVFDKNYENEQRWSDERSYERAAGRVEVSPVTPANENYFLNVMQVMDKTLNEKRLKKDIFRIYPNPVKEVLKVNFPEDSG